MFQVTPRLLITDDDLRLRHTLRDVFEDDGFRTFVAGSGEEALEIVRQEPIDLLLMDMHMPRLTGLETIRLVKKFKRQLPCILMSAALDEELIQEALQSDASEVLAKPITRRRALDTVHTVLRVAYNWPLDERSSH